MRQKFNRGDLVVLCRRSYEPSVARYFGRVARVEFSERVCEDYHKGHYTTAYRLRFILDGAILNDVMEDALEPIDPISALGNVGNAP